MSNRFTQSRSDTQKHQAILKDLLRRPENKLCADCKRNDPRWASVNIGCMLCLRCSGIHRGLGVHISRVRSIDLDTWTPENIAHLERWGNRRVNAYWEAHLKPGHLPPDHKIESFIRSKYELKRWAMDGPVPDPETLDGGDAAPAEPSRTSSASPAPAPARKSAATTSIDLLSAPPSSSAPPRTSSRTAAPAPAAAKKPEASLFDLDFGAPAPSPSHAATPAAAAPQPPKRDPKADILSLFASTPAPARPAHAPQGSFSSAPGGVAGVTGGLAGLSFGSGTPAPPVPSGGFDAGWGATSTSSSATVAGASAFGDFSSAPSAPAAASAADPWTSSSSTSTSGLWGAPAAAPAPAPAQKADPFAEFGAFSSKPASGPGAGGFGADIWGAPPSTTSAGSTGGANGAGASAGGFSDIWG
ncbi:ARF GAP with effector function(s) [Rhodotorula kratochvilovae]